MKREELTTELKNFREIRNYIVEVLRDNNIDKRVISETLLVFEALYNDMLEEGMSEDMPVRVRGVRSFGDVRVKLGFEGGRYVPLSKFGNSASAEDRVMAAYADKMENSYHSGYNNIAITARRSYSRSVTRCLLGFLLAIVAYIPIMLLVPESTQSYLLDEVVFPLEKVFTNAVLMVGAPVTFFSLLSHLTDAYIVSERESDMRRINRDSLITSAAAVLMAVGASMIAVLCLELVYTIKPNYSDMGLDTSLSKLLESLISTSIFEPFETFAPFPLIVLAGLATYALCSAGLYFDRLKTAIDAGYMIFSKMLSAVMFMLPAACFLAILDTLLDTGIVDSLKLLAAFVVITVSLVFLALFYVARLAAAGVDVREFINKLRPLIIENAKINSSIDAVPFNIRYCTTRYGMNRRRVENMLPVLAQVNLDGNCFLITLAALLFMFSNGIPFDLSGIVVIGILVLFLSLGAPNQPGSCLIGMLIIINYLGAPEMIAVTIIAEVLLGSLLNLTNTIGDIVTVAVDDAKLKGRK